MIYILNMKNKNKYEIILYHVQLIERTHLSFATDNIFSYQCWIDPFLCISFSCFQRAGSNSIILLFSASVIAS